jgi:hypothetical protein
VSAFEHLVQVLLLFASFAQVGVPHAGKLCPVAQGSVVPSSQDDSINDTTKPPMIAKIKISIPTDSNLGSLRCKLLWFLTAASMQPNPSLSVFFIKLS